MRLPQNREKWTGTHAEKAIKHAWKLLEEYENKLGVLRSQEEINKLMQPYLSARDTALQVARVTEHKVLEAEELP